MIAELRMLAAAGALLFAFTASEPVRAQKQGGILRMWDFDSPASMSILEESTIAAERPMMGVFNNLVLFDQHIKQNSLSSIVPELATKWSWNEEGTELTLPLRQGVKWHDGKPFTAKDVKCTWDLLTGNATEKLRLNPRKSWYRNLEEVRVDSDYQVTFRLKRPQPSFMEFLATGWSPIYPCHVPAREMRSHPIGTGPFKFVEFKPNQSITVARNPNYWKQGRPYLDGIEYAIIKDPATARLAFVAGKFDMTWPYNITIPVLKDIQSQAPTAECEVDATNVNRTVIFNQSAPPFDNAELRRAVSLALDRKAFVDIITQGQGEVGGTMLPPPEGIWGMPAEMLQTLPGYGPDVERHRAKARAILEKLGYGPNKKLTVTVSTRNVPPYRDPAVILISQLNEIYMDATLDTIDTVNWYPKVMRKDFTIGLSTTESALDDPDQQFYESYVCGADRNYTGYCNPELDKLVDRQSMEPDVEKRRKLVWQIEKMLVDDDVRPVIFYPRMATCRYPHVKGLTVMVNSIYNGWRMEDVWLDK